MKHAQDVLVRPVISEKSYTLMEDNKYTFEVHPSAGKTEIRQAVEEIFDVEVTKINTMRRRGKNRRQGWTTGRTRDWRKAIVTLKEGDRIEFFDSK
ncbi:MAG: 50S ribosomal protein L23 [Terriglobia bacterium]